MTYTDIMLDFETLADTQNAAILSMAAVPFNLETGEMGKAFYEYIDLQSCLEVGMEVTGNTFYWWLTKSEDARQEITSNDIRRHIQYIPSAFRAWLTKSEDARQEINEKEIRIWGNGAKFDLGILDNLYRKTQVINPFNFRNERCVRTYASLRPEIMANFEYHGTKHHPVDDCRNQIRYVCLIHADTKKVPESEIIRNKRREEQLEKYEELLIETIKTKLGTSSSYHIGFSKLPEPENCIIGQVACTNDGKYVYTSKGWVLFHINLRAAQNEAQENTPKTNNQS